MSLYPHKKYIKYFDEEYNDDKIIVEYKALVINNLTDIRIIYSFGIFLSIIIICFELINNLNIVIFVYIYLSVRKLLQY